MEEKPSTAVTPIKRSMKHQKDKGAKEINLEGRRLKSYDTTFNGRDVAVLFDEESNEVIIDGKAYSVDLSEEEGYYHAKVEDSHVYRIEYHGGQIYLEGRVVEFNFEPSVPKLERKTAVKEGEIIVEAPLPGNVTEIAVKIGDTVQIGQKILVLEAMKMQNDITSSVEGTVKEIYVKQGDLVTNSQKLMLIEAATQD